MNAGKMLRVLPIVPDMLHTTCLGEGEESLEVVVQSQSQAQKPTSAAFLLFPYSV